jgi:hypothetical protein
MATTMTNILSLDLWKIREKMENVCRVVLKRGKAKNKERRENGALNI